MNKRRTFLKLFIYGLLLLVIFISLYSLFLRDLWINKGITKTEMKRELPGDNYVKSPDTSYQQAITINAPTNIVWAYLIQVGYQRAGWYNWDFINRWAAKDYFYTGEHSAEHIIFHLQDLSINDRISILPDISFKVEKIKKEKFLLLTAKEKDNYVVTWTYELRKLQDNQTRLLVRWKSDLGEGFLFDIMNYAITEPGGAGIQQWEMLKGIKKRAERDYQKIKKPKVSKDG